MAQSDSSLISVLLKITSNFNKNNVQYLLIGGIAVNFHGYHRQSHNLPDEIDFDIDIWYEPTVTNFTHLTKAIKSLGIPRAHELDNIIFDSKKTFLRIVHNNYKLELLSNIDGFDKMDFIDCFQRRVEFDLDGEFITVISYDDLLANKKAMSRPIDKEDIEELEKLKRHPGEDGIDRSI
ncbi:MAG: nucleotidyltransferase [bacterium]|nr:nucleotidyltransferase [bacterium]